MSGILSLQAVWLADSVEVHDDDGKCSVHRMFDQVSLPPGTVLYEKIAYLFFSLRRLRGKAQLVLTLVDLADDTALRALPVTAEGYDPIRTTDVMARMTWMPLPHAGAYVWNVSDKDGNILGSCRFEVRIEQADGSDH